MRCPYFIVKQRRYRTKDKVIKMASMLDKMDPEVAKKRLSSSWNFQMPRRKCSKIMQEMPKLGLFHE